MQGSILSYIYVVLIGQIYWLLFLTCLEWCLVLLRRWKNLSHLAHKLPQLSQRMIASVSPSSWLWQVGLSGPPTPPPRSPLLRRSTWSLSSTQRAATAGHKCHILYLIPSSGILWSGPRRVRLRTVSPIALLEKLIQSSLNLPWVTSLRSWTISWNPFLICDIDSHK